MMAVDKRKPMDRFRSTEDELLIDMVAEHQVLWNVHHQDCSNYVIKDTIWRKIGKMLDRSAQDCRIRWRSIRDHYKKQMKPERKTLGVKKKRASYWGKLGFLDAVLYEQELSISRIYAIAQSSGSSNRDDTENELERDPLAIDLENDNHEDNSEDEPLQTHQVPTSREIKISDCFIIYGSAQNSDSTYNHPIVDKENELEDNCLVIDVDVDAGTGNRKDYAEDQSVQTNHGSNSASNCFMKYANARSSESTYNENPITQCENKLEDGHLVIDAETCPQENYAGQSLHSYQVANCGELKISDEVSLAGNPGSKRKKPINDKLSIETSEDSEVEDKHLFVQKHVGQLEPEAEDEIDLFFKAMAATVKKFHPTHRTYAKMKVFRIISELELCDQKQ